ncbi:MAG: LytR C-terminal domain-containing protein [Lachnospiraceae bacterium]|nr:LytR C-terminal domain-containing protein [Lachnospiraceae bacterium]
MKKNNVVKVFFISLLKSILFIIILLVTGFASYKISYTILSDNGGNIGTSKGDIADIIEDAQTDEVSRNLIYVYNGDRITNLMLEICNTKTNNMDYVTIPVRTEYTIPTTMYQKLCTVNQEIPQIIRIGRIKTYFANSDDAFGYGELIIEKMLGIKISYYTVLDQETYNSHYTRKRVRVRFKPGQDTITATPGPDGIVPQVQYIRVPQRISVASNTYVNQLKDISGDQEKIAEYIKEQYERVESNLTVYNKIGYIECYEKMNVDYFHYWGVPGTYNGKIFSVDTKAAKSFLNKLADNTTAYTEPQESSAVTKNGNKAKNKNSKTKSSKGLNIIVLNGSRINGLASATQTKLNADGFSVNQIGDYTDETLTHTRIIVKEDGIGNDLAGYFTDPEIVTGDVQEGFDIEIILGTADAN